MAGDNAQTSFTVFGSRGFIGRHVVAYLAERGVSVYAPDRAQIASGEVEARDLGQVAACPGPISLLPSPSRRARACR